ncbi:hypothetical protein AB0K15_18900 [Amycolatopsis sp. NPDC049253]|uniref:hypothetical protein n=1 Tax=Amycolatopsis sp. NPDC049253 TaxID=3155274 RepID=UPI00342974C8
MTTTSTATDAILAGFNNDDIFSEYGSVYFDQALTYLTRWLDSVSDQEDALIEMHAAIVRRAQAGWRSELDHVSEVAAVVSGLARAVQHSRTPMPADVLLNLLAHALCALWLDWTSSDRKDHLQMARNWMAQAYLVAGVQEPTGATR